MANERIPIFPLEVVLLPEAVLPLHIFEPRYKEMIRVCQADELDFGVVLQRESGIAAVGCTAEITQILKTYDDGRMDLLALGRRPFRIRDVIEDAAYLQADVEYLEDEPSATSAAQRRLLEKYGEIHTLLFGAPPPHLDAGEVESVAYSAASELPLDLDLRQALLEVRDEPQRQRLLLDHIEKWLPVAAHQKRIKKIAGGNGHGLH